MTAIYSRVVTLHAQALDLAFLGPVVKEVEKILESRLESYTIHEYLGYNQLIYTALAEPSPGLVVILAHGARDYILGGERRNRLTGGVVQGQPFLTKDHLTSLKGHLVFCLSCDSNGLAKACLDAGAQSFVGFDEVPFYQFDASDEPVRNDHLEAACKDLIASAVMACLRRFLTGASTLDEAVDYMRLRMCKHAVAYAREQKLSRQAKEVAALHLRMREGVRYHGRRGIRFERAHDRLPDKG